MSDPQAYLDLMRNATNMTNVFWVPNNPYELHYMQQKGVVPPPERTRVIRPLGYSHLGGLPLDISAANKTATGLKLAVVAAHNNLALLIPHLEKAGIPYNGLIKRRYGGPLTLGRYDLVLDVPYQVGACHTAASCRSDGNHTPGSYSARGQSTCLSSSHPSCAHGALRGKPAQTIMLEG